MRCGELWEECRECKKRHSGVHVNQGIVMLEIVFFITVSDLHSDRRWTGIQPPMLQRFYHDTRHCLDWNGKDDVVNTIAIAAYNVFVAIKGWQGRNQIDSRATQKATSESMLNSRYTYAMLNSPITGVRNQKI